MKRNILLFGVVSAFLFSCNKQESLQETQVVENIEMTQQGEYSTLATTIVNVTPSTNLNATFWSNIQTQLQSNPVDVVFADGTYNLTSTINLNNIGHVTNRLQLKCNTKGSAVLTGSITKLMGLSNSQNILIHRLKFTGPLTGYGLTIQKSENITVAYCIFKDMPNANYGAIGVHYAASNNVIIRHSQFENIGFDSHAHMIYGSYGVKRLKVINNTFKDCSGSYVRFRGDNSTHG